MMLDANSHFGSSIAEAVTAFERPCPRVCFLSDNLGQ